MRRSRPYTTTIPERDGGARFAPPTLAGVFVRAMLGPQDLQGPDGRLRRRQRRRQGPPNSPRKFCPREPAEPHQTRITTISLHTVRQFSCLSYEVSASSVELCLTTCVRSSTYRLVSMSLTAPRNGVAGGNNVRSSVLLSRPAEFSDGRSPPAFCHPQQRPLGIQGVCAWRDYSIHDEIPDHFLQGCSVVA